MSKITKHAVLVLIILIGVSVILQDSMQARQKRMTVEEQVKILKKKLKLDKRQTAKITIILEDQRESLATVANENRNDKEARRTAIREVVRETDVKIKAVLTEEQAATYDEMIKKRIEQMKARSEEADSE